MIAAGLGLLVAGFAFGYLIGVPHTVAQRVMMWLGPWNNTVHGGDQLAQSLWAFATGGTLGAGIGLGDPAVVPAAHTDLILSALGEEWGFIGVIAVFALYAILLWRALRIALRAASDYEFFLATGLATAIGLQVLLIAAGSLGVFPLSGVVTPFLSYGRTALLASFLMFAMLLSISRRPAEEDRNQPFQMPVRALGVALGALALVVAGKAAYVQVARASRKSCARFRRAQSWIATGCRWPPAAGRIWRRIAPTMPSWVSIRSTWRRARRAAIIRSAG
jgi:hypothetical protein